MTNVQRIVRSAARMFRLRASSRRTCGVAATLLAVALSPAAAAEPAVPIEKDPRHLLVVENRFVRVFDVDIAPGDATLFHTHVHDGVGIKLSDTRIRDEVLGGSSNEIDVETGAVSFAYRPSPLTHRVVNVGETAFLNVFVEILPAAADTQHGGKVLAALARGSGIVLENERVRVSRRVLAPGDSMTIDAPSHGQLAVAMSGGTIAIEGEDAPVAFEPGDVRWHEGATRHVWANAGGAAFVTIAIELK